MDRPYFTLSMALDVLEQMEAGQEGAWLFYNCGDMSVAQLREWCSQENSPVSLSSPATLADNGRVSGHIQISVPVNCKGLLWHNVIETYEAIFFPKKKQ